MDSIGVLKLNKRMFRVMGLLTSANELNKQEGHLRNIILIGIQLAVWFPIFAHLLYIWGDISGTTDAMYTVCTFSMALEMYAFFVIRKQKLNHLLRKLNDIISKRKYLKVIHGHERF